MISGNQELPKVLYIVPWQDPSGIPKIELDPNFTEHEVFRRLYPPAYKRELAVLRRAEVVEGKSRVRRVCYRSNRDLRQPRFVRSTVKSSEQSRLRWFELPSRTAT